MTYDLRAGLGAIGDEERTAAAASLTTSLPVDELRARARRRRAVRVAATATTSLLAAGGIAVGAFALASPHGTPPAVAPSPTTSTTTPTPDVPAWPPATHLDGALPGCGDPLPDVVPASQDGTGAQGAIALEATVPSSATAGTTVTVTSAVTFPSAPVPPVESPQLVVVRDGVVAGSTGGPDGFTYDSPEATLTLADVALPLVGCDGAPLPAGSYEIYVLEQVQHRDANGAVLDGDPLTVVGGPYPLAVEAPVDPHPAVEDLVISTAGLGPLAVGLAPDDNPGAAMIELHPGACLETWGGAQPGANPDRWYPTYPSVDPAEPGRFPFRVMVASDRIVWIDVLDARPHTSSGIRVGSTKEDLLAAYPAATELSGGVPSISRSWSVADAAGTIVFEVATWDDGTGERPVGTVVRIAVFPPDADPVAFTYATDNVADGCM